MLLLYNNHDINKYIWDWNRSLKRLVRLGVAMLMQDYMRQFDFDIFSM